MWLFIGIIIILLIIEEIGNNDKGMTNMNASERI